MNSVSRAEAKQQHVLLNWKMKRFRDNIVCNNMHLKNPHFTLFIQWSETMETLYWSLIIFGVLYALVTLLFTEVMDHIFDALIGDSGLDFLQPTVLVSGLTVFGAAGLLLDRYTLLSTAWIIVLAIAIAILGSIGVYFLYVRPMENRENSLGYSIQDLIGSIGDVSISIPSQGYGEVIVRAGLSNTNHIAASFDGESIPQDSRVVIVEVKDHTVYVSPLDTGNSPV